MEFWMFGHFPAMNSKLGVCGDLDTKVNSHKNEMAKFFGEDYTDRVLNFSDSLKKLAPTLEEVSIMRVILITFTGESNPVEQIMRVFYDNSRILLVCSP